jgi:hypothetical protein
MNVPWIAVLRDAFAIVIARSLARWIFGAFGLGDSGLLVVDALVLVAAFCLVGCASPAQRAARLGLTALATWTVLLVVNLVRGATLPSSFDFAETALAMLIGGAASLAIVRPPGAAGVAGGPPPQA